MEQDSLRNLKRYNHLLGEIDATYHEASLKLGVSDSVSKILYTICNVGDACLLSTICKETGLSKQTVNSALRNLEKDGLIYLEAVGGKTKNVCLTEKGKEFAGKTALCLIQIENDIFASWPIEEVQKYLQLTEKFLDYLKERVDAIGQEGAEKN